jgi:Uncharacterised protein family (UPF0158)
MGSKWLAIRSGRISAAIPAKVVTVDDETAFLAEEDEPDDDWPQWQLERWAEARRVLNSDEFIALPSQFEINEWSIMKRFAESLDDARDGDDLLEAIHGKGAFRAFKILVTRMGLREAWFKFRDEALAEIAIDFLKEHGIPYVAD